MTSARLLGTTRPLSDPGRWWRVAPLAGFAGFAAAATEAGWLGTERQPGAELVAALLAASVVAVLAALGLPWRRWPDRWQAALPLAYFGVVALLDYAGGLYYLAALPIIWLALFHSRRAMMAGVGLFAAVLFLPRLLVPEAYPVPGVMAELVLVFALITVAGLAMQGLVEHIRTVAAESAAAARQARADRDLLNAYLDNAPCLVVVLEPDSRVLLYNRFAEQVLGYRAEDVVGQQAYYHLYEDVEARASFERVVAGDWPQEREGDTVTSAGGVRRIVWNTTALTDDTGRVTHVISTGMDVTEQRAATEAALAREREAAERLRQLDQVKNDFVATVSHDLRTPLTSIIGNTELLLDGDAGPLSPSQSRLLAAIDRNGRRLDTLVGDLLLLSRIESGTLRINRRPIAMRQIIDGAMEALAAKLTADLRLEVVIPAEPVVVQGDPDQLERVVTNLLSNALKFTPPGGQVSVTLTAGEDQVQVSVADTGIGIPSAELANVFDRFFRSSRSQQNQSPGTGLGLTIARSIVEHHDGTIQASANPAGGTVFTVTLPRLAADADADATVVDHR